MKSGIIITVLLLFSSFFLAACGGSPSQQQSSAPQSSIVASSSAQASPSLSQSTASSTSASPSNSPTPSASGSGSGDKSGGPALQDLFAAKKSSAFKVTFQVNGDFDSQKMSGEQVWTSKGSKFRIDTTMTLDSTKISSSNERRRLQGARQGHGFAVQAGAGASRSSGTDSGNRSRAITGACPVVADSPLGGSQAETLNSNEVSATMLVLEEATYVCNRMTGATACFRLPKDLGVQAIKADDLTFDSAHQVESALGKFTVTNAYREQIAGQEAYCFAMKAVWGASKDPDMTVCFGEQGIPLKTVAKGPSFSKEMVATSVVNTVSDDEFNLPGKVMDLPFDPRQMPGGTAEQVPGGLPGQVPGTVPGR